MTYIFFESHLIIPWLYTHLQKYITTCRIWGITQYEQGKRRTLAACSRNEQKTTMICDNFHHLVLLNGIQIYNSYMAILDKMKAMPHNAVLIAHCFVCEYPI